MTHDQPAARPPGSTAGPPCPGGSDAVLVCHAGQLTKPGLAAVDFLARLHTTARRRGQVVLVCHAPRALLELLDVAGVAGVIRVVSVLEPGREAEQREQPVGAEEGVHRLDLPP